MIRAMTSTCMRDRDYALRLNKQLTAHGVDHHIFIEPHEMIYFGASLNVHFKPVGGDNGYGQGGTLVRWNCHQQMLNVVRPGDTFVNIDSDVFFANEAMIADLACAPGEVKGFTTGERYVVDGESFVHMSGMIIAAASDVFVKAMSLPRLTLIRACERVRANPIARISSTPSEDVMASYLYQIRAGARVTNLGTKYTRNLSKLYYSKDFDVIC